MAVLAGGRPRADGRQIGHFNVYAPEKVPYAIERDTKETNRLYGVLAGRAFVAGEYSIADIACYPWIVPHEAHGQDLDDFPHLKRWFETIAARPATIRAYAGATDVYSRAQAPLSDDARKALFGQTAASVQG